MTVEHISSSAHDFETVATSLGDMAIVGLGAYGLDKVFNEPAQAEKENYTDRAYLVGQVVLADSEN